MKSKILDTVKIIIGDIVHKHTLNQNLVVISNLTPSKGAW
jgi:hypothetical protein